MRRISPRTTPLTVALLSLVASTALAQSRPASTLHNDPAFKTSVEAQGERLVAAINSTDPAFRVQALQDVLAADAQANGGEARFLALLGRLRDRYVQLRYHHSEAISHGDGDDRRVSLHVYALSAKDSAWKDLQFMLTPQPPHRIQSIAFIADVAEPVYLPNGDITDPFSLDWLGGYVDKLARDDDLAGGLLVAVGDRVIFERSFGFADHTRRRPIAAQTRFNLASGGKMFTALLIAQLAEKGRLTYSDPIIQHLPDLAREPFARNVTISHLLSHTSGIGEFWTDEYERQWNEIRTLRHYLPFVKAAKTRFPAGERFEYCNSNYILAGLVIEAVTGQSYDAALSERILKPLGMRATGLDPFDDADTLQSSRLRRGVGGWEPAPHGYRGSSAGGGLSTLADMFRFARALVTGRIVAPKTLEIMTTSQTAGLPDAPLPYGYGFILERTAGGVRSFGHGGIAQGVNFELRYFPDWDITLLAFSNQDNGAYDDLRRNATRLITGER